MNKLSNWLKSIRFDRIVTAFLVGLVLFVSTACKEIASAKTADEIRSEVPSSAVTNKYKGGMNDYSDVDPRANITAAKAKAKELVDKAQRNINKKSIDSPEQYVENYRSGTPMGERVKRIGEDVSESAQNLKEDVSKGSQENYQRAKVRVPEATKKVTGAFKQVKENAQDTAKDAANNIQKAADKAADAID